MRTAFRGLQDDCRSVDLGAQACYIEKAARFVEVLLMLVHQFLRLLTKARLTAALVTCVVYKSRGIPQKLSSLGEIHHVASHAGVSLWPFVERNGQSKFNIHSTCI